MAVLFKSLRLYRDANGDIEYMGKHTKQDAATSEPGWQVWKFHRDADDKLEYLDGPIQGILDHMESLDWGV